MTSASGIGLNTTRLLILAITDVAHAFSCCKVRDACLDIKPNPHTWDQWRGNMFPRSRMPKQFVMRVAGETQEELDTITKKCMLLKIREPVKSSVLRHLENDIVASPDRAALFERRVWGGENLTMFWPVWENGYGDVLADTILPLSDLHRRKILPAAPVAFSGIEPNTLIQQLQSFYPGRSCASERAMPNQSWKRCESRCYSTISVCQVSQDDVHEAWEARAAIDTAMGWRNVGSERDAWQTPRRQSLSGSAEVRIIWVARQPHGTHSRRIVNQEELVRKCNRTIAENVVFRCELLSEGLDTPSKVRILQGAQVMVTMWGGDTINALHMKRDAVAIELVNQAFSKFGPQAWVWQQKKWVTQSKTSHSQSARKNFGAGRLSYHTLNIPFNRTVLTPTSSRCLDHLPQDRKAEKRWECIWNNDMHVGWASLRAFLTRVVGNNLNARRRPLRSLND